MIIRTELCDVYKIVFQFDICLNVAPTKASLSRYVFQCRRIIPEGPDYNRWSAQTGNRWGMDTMTAELRVTGYVVDGDFFNHALGGVRVCVRGGLEWFPDISWIWCVCVRVCKCVYV